jgi:hypothetical protein
VLGAGFGKVKGPTGLLLQGELLSGTSMNSRIGIHLTRVEQCYALRYTRKQAHLLKQREGHIHLGLLQRPSSSRTEQLSLLLHSIVKAWFGGIVAESVTRHSSYRK